MELEIIKNKLWNNGNTAPCFTVLTGVYNRSETLWKAMKSVENQTFRDLEYIIVNDGSTENIDDVVFDFMYSTTIPVLYVTKENGGVHTARNLGVRLARGGYLVGIDSDDELVPEALEIFYRAWQTIPKEKRSEYRGVVGQCKDQNGKRSGSKFPEDINERPWREVRKIVAGCKGEHSGCGRMDIRKENPFPEPEKITFVSESVLWNDLAKRYKEWYINDIVRIWNTDSVASLSKQSDKRFSDQQIINSIWNSEYVINHFNKEDYSIKYLFKNHVKHNCCMIMAKQRGIDMPSSIGMISGTQLLLGRLLFFPSLLVTWMFTKGTDIGFVKRLLR